MQYRKPSLFEGFVVRGPDAKTVSVQGHLTTVPFYRSGHLYRGMTEDEYEDTVGQGRGVKSSGAYSFSFEGTSFAERPETAESYVNFGRDDPRKTGRSNFLIEVRKTESFQKTPDGYWKAESCIPDEDITRVWEMFADGDNIVAEEIT